MTLHDIQVYIHFNYYDFYFCYSWFAVLCQFLLYNKATQSCMCVYIHTLLYIHTLFFFYYPMWLCRLRTWRVHEDVGSIPGLTPWVKYLGIVISCGVDLRSSWELVLPGCGVACSYSSNLTSSLGISICHRCSHKKQKKKKKKKGLWVFFKRDVLYFGKLGDPGYHPCASCSPEHSFSKHVDMLYSLPVSMAGISVQCQDVSVWH